MGFSAYLWVCHFFHSASHREPPRLEWEQAKHLQRWMRADEFTPNIFVCVWVKISFSSLQNSKKMNLLKSPLHLFDCSLRLLWVVSLSSSPPLSSFHISLRSHSIETVLCCLFVEAMCIHSELHMFPVNIQGWIHSRKLQLLRLVLQIRSPPWPALSFPDPKINVGETTKWTA